MNLLLKVSSLVITLGLLTAACRKNDNPAPPVVPNYPVLYLDHIVELDTTRSAPRDTISKTFFTYDALNRLVFDSSYFISTPYNILSFSTIAIHYSGSDTLASWAMTRSWTNPAQIDTITANYTFNAGRYVKDTVIYDYASIQPGSSRTNYFYADGKMIRDFQNWLPSINYSDKDFDTARVTFVDGDITYMKDSLYSISNGQNAGTQIHEANFVYLSNPNPFYQAGKSISIPFYLRVGNGEWGLYNEHIPKKLLSKVTSNFGNLSYTYKFRPDGYPASSFVVKDPINPVPVSKFLFYYK